MKKLTLIITAVLAIGAAAYYTQVLGSENALINRFPDYDPKLVVDTHREFVKETLAGKYDGVQLTDDLCDQIFKEKLDRRTR